MNRQQGFTIIEVILFLAISGSLAALLLVGMGTAIQQQQYRESVQSFASFLRSQYSRVINVENSRPDSAVCPIPGVESGSSIGQSECVVIGRYIRSDNGEGSSYLAYPVYGYKNPATSDWIYALGDSDSEYSVQWEAKSRYSHQPVGSTNISILMYRHPDMGNLAIRTDSSSHASDINTFFVDNVSFGERKEICVYSEGWLSGQSRSIELGVRSGSSDAVSVINSTGGCD